MQEQATISTTRMNVLIWMQFFCVLLVNTQSGDAQVIFDELQSSNGLETSGYAKVKDILLSNFASRETERNHDNIEGLSQKVNLNLDRILKLEDELKIGKENYSLNEKNTIDLISDGYSNLTKQIKTLESKLTLTTQTSRTLFNESLEEFDDKVVKLSSENDNKYEMIMDKLDIKIADLIHNITMSMSTLENYMKVNSTNIQQDIATIENYFQEQIAKTNDSFKMNLELKKELDEKYSIFAENITNKLQNFNEQLKTEGIEQNMTLLSLQQRLNDLVEDKMILSDEITNAKTEMRRNVSDVIAKNELFKNDILNNVTNLMDDQQQNIVQNMSVIEESTKQNFETQLKAVSNNMSSQIKNIEDVFFTHFEELGSKSNKTIKHTFDLIEEVSERINEKLNETRSGLKNVTAELENFHQRITSVENNQEHLGISTHSSLESIQLIAANISSLNESLTQTMSSLDDDVKLISRLFTSRLNSFSENITELHNMTTSFELIHDSQNMRIVDIETRLSITTETSVNIYSDIIRLRNSQGDRTYGRVEVLNNGVWGTVCDDNWDNNDAKVACRMLGLGGGRAMKEAYYGAGTGTIWLDEMGCSGNELSLFDCRHNTIGSHDCSHSEDAGVVCT